MKSFNHGRFIMVIALAFITVTACLRPAAGAVGLATPATGIEFVLDYKSSKSKPPTTDHETALQDAMAEAARQWETIYPDVPRQVITINYWWDSGDATSTGLVMTGFHSPSEQPALLTQLILPVSTYRLRFFEKWVDSTGSSVDVPYYLQTGSFNDDDFNMSQTLYRDGPSPDPFYGVPPDLLEVAYSGDALAGGGAEEMVDLYTLALHHIGQILFDVSPGTTTSFLLASFTARFTGISALSVNVEYGRIPFDTLMSDAGFSPLGRRILPSTTDIFAIAASNGWTEVRLPRREMLLPYGGDPDHEWKFEAEWLGDHVPNSRSAAYVRDTTIQEVRLAARAKAKEMYLGWDLDSTDPSLRQFLTDTYNLNVVNELLIEHNNTELVVNTDGSVTAGAISMLLASQMFIDVNGSVFAGGLFDQFDGKIYMDHGLLEAATIDIYTGSVIRGSGSIWVSDDLINDGLIETDQGGPLRIYGGMLDLDGEHTSEDGQIVAEQSGIFFDGAFSDGFGGLMSIGAFVNATDPLEVAAGQVSFIGDKDPYLIAPEINVSGGRISANAMGSRISASSIYFAWGSLVEVGGSLELDGHTIFDTDGCTYSGAGTVEQTGDVTVRSGSEVTLDFATYNWDGDRTSHRTIIEPAAVLHITGEMDIYVSALGNYLGKIIISEGATLIVDVDWELHGTIVLNGGSIGTSLVPGGEITNLGTVRGHGDVFADFDNDGQVCEMDGSLNFEGRYNGPPSMCP